jgi:hypothetical protein
MKLLEKHFAEDYRLINQIIIQLILSIHVFKEPGHKRKIKFPRFLVNGKGNVTNGASNRCKLLFLHESFQCGTATKIVF